MKPYLNPPIVRARIQPSVSPFFAQPITFHWPAGKVSDMRTNRPAANVLRTENGFQIELAIPGIPKDQIKIQVVENELLVTANVQTNEKETRFVRKEFDYNGFKRSFTLHQDADTDNLKASFDQGILTIVIPNREPEMKKIEIQ